MYLRHILCLIFTCSCIWAVSHFQRSNHSNNGESSTRTFIPTGNHNGIIAQNYYLPTNRTRNWLLRWSILNPATWMPSLLKRPLIYFRNIGRNRQNRHECERYRGWKATTSAWDDKLRPMQMLLCLVNNSSNKGNCLYDAIANAYNTAKVKIENLEFNHDLETTALALSINNLEPRSGKITGEYIRTLAAIHFIGVNPNDTHAFDEWDHVAFERKLEFFADAVAAGHYTDVRWKPRQKLEMLRAKPRDPATVKKIFNELKNVKTVAAWGGYDELVALSQILDTDFLIFHNDNSIIQQVSFYKGVLGTRPVVLLYYYPMLHFCNAGLVDKSASDELRAYITPENYPHRLNKLIL